MAKDSAHKRKVARAGALLCPVCCVEYVEVEFDCEVDGIVLPSVKAMRCPICGVEVFSPEQQQNVTDRLNQR